MKKKGHRPVTKVKNPEPNIESPDWVIWAAWADRITFEEIEKKTGYKESDVIKIMRRSLKPSSFCLLYTSPSPRDVEESRMPSSA